jgi:KDO2-lipid IV(A) lauroyltransferase
MNLRQAHRVGALIGKLMWTLRTRAHSTATSNINAGFRELSAEDRRRLVRASLIETGRTFAEAGALLRWPVERLRTLERGVVDADRLDQALASKNGTILLVPHLGNWEIFNHFLMDRCQLAALYRAPRIAELDETLRAARERTGCTMVPATSSGVLQLRRLLKKEGLVMILPDQEPVRSSGIFVPFFGVPALTMTLAPRLLAKSGASVLIGISERIVGEGFRLHFRQVSPLVSDPDLETATTALNCAVEKCVRDFPEQYHWGYKRFKSRPEGAAPFYRKRK